MGCSFTVFWAICTRRRIGSNRFISFNFTPSAATLAQLVYVFVPSVLHSCMMSLLSFGYNPSMIGMSHHCSFCNPFGGILPLIWPKFRYIVNKFILFLIIDGRL